MYSPVRGVHFGLSIVSMNGMPKMKKPILLQSVRSMIDGKYYRLNCSMTVVFNERYHSAEHGARVGNVNGKRFIKRVVK